MSDENISDAQRQLSAAMQQQADDYARYGKMQASTAIQLKDAQEFAAFGLKNYTAATGMAGKAVGALAGAAVTSAAEMYKGSKGMSAFNSSLDDISTAVGLAAAAITMLVGGPLGILAGGLAMAASAAIAYTKAANEMSDKLYKSYTGLQKSGAAASDGMTGVFRDAKKLGLSMNELDSFTSLIAENSQDLALFSGTVYDGRKKFADMSEAMKGSRVEFFKMGITQTELNDGMAGYLRTVTRTGRAQTMSTDQLASSARSYITEQDALAKMTGIGVKQQQAALDKALQNEQFLAKIRQLEANGETDKADELKRLNVYYQAIGDEAAEGFQATVNGNLRNKAAQKLNFSTQGEAMRSTQMVLSGQLKAAGAADRVYGALGEHEKGIARQQAQFGIASETGLKYSETVNGAILANGEKRTELDKKILKDQEAQKRGADKITDNQGNMVMTQQEINKKLEEAVFDGIPIAQANMARLAVATDVLANVFTTLTNGLNRLLSLIGLGEKKDKIAEKSVEISSTEKQLAAATAAQKTAKTPEEKIAANREEKFYREKLELLKQEKTVVQGEKDLADAKAAVIKRSQDELDLAEAAYDKQLETATRLQKLGIGQDKAQTLAREKYDAAVLKRNQMTVTGGPGQAAAVQAELAKKSGAAPRSAAAPSAAAPSAPSAAAPSAAATDKSLAFTGSSGSKSNFEQLNPAVKDRVTAAAEQYNEATGKKITVNSAKRDPADQARIYKETVDAGRPGIGPNGMAVAKPGRSKHEQGLAIDIQNYNDPAAVSAMNSKGLSQTVPKDPVHFTIPSAEEGGIVSGPAGGYNAKLHGTEAVIPMQNNSGDFVKMFETMAVQSSRMADMLETLVRAQRDGNDISTKILRQQA